MQAVSCKPLLLPQTRPPQTSCAATRPGSSQLLSRSTQSKICCREDIAQSCRAFSFFALYAWRTTRSESPTYRTRETLIRAEASSSEPYEPPEDTVTGSEAWRSRKSAIVLPKFASKAEHTFLIATVLKIMLLASLFPKDFIFKPLGYTPQGLVAWLVLVPFAAVLVFLSSVILQSDFMKRRRAGLVIVLLSAALLTFSSQLYGYKRPVPSRGPKTSRVVPRQDDWQTRMITSSQPRTAEDSDEVWRHVKEDSQE